MSLYLPFIRQYLPLVLSQIDRDEDSPTYGCCDRNHWHLKTRDFASAILQQSGLAVALAWSVPYPNSPYYQNPKMREWAKATLDYAVKIQLRDGSFNEYYPWEHGFPPTAFCLYALCETYRILNLDDDKILKCLKKAGKYLAKHDEVQALNQEMASCTGLYFLSELTSEDWVKRAFNRKTTALLSKQSSDGFFAEYGGADIGYLSVTLDMLSAYYQRSRDERVRPVLDKMTDFISYFVHPDGTAGGAYGSRNTTYFLPAGLQVMASLGHQKAMALKQILYQKQPSESFLAGVDDRYWSHYLLHSFLRACQTEREMPEKKVSPIKTEPHFVHFKEAGLLHFQNKDYQAVCAGFKGGVLKVFKGEKELFCDTGYRFRYGKKIAVTNWQDTTFEVKQGESSLEINGFFNLVRPKVPTPFLHMALRGLSFVFGQRLIRILKKQMIFSGAHSSVSFSRRISFEDKKIYLTDTINAPFEVSLKKAPVFSMRHVASGKFFTSTDLLDKKEMCLTFSGQRTIDTVLDIEKETEDVLS